LIKILLGSKAQATKLTFILKYTDIITQL
jgi:hypothetical protein